MNRRLPWRRWRPVPRTRPPIGISNAVSGLTHSQRAPSPSRIRRLAASALSPPAAPPTGRRGAGEAVCKIEDSPSNPRYLVTVHNLGYELNA